MSVPSLQCIAHQFVCIFIGDPWQLAPLLQPWKCKNWFPFKVVLCICPGCVLTHSACPELHVGSLFACPYSDLVFGCLPVANGLSPTVQAVP